MITPELVPDKDATVVADPLTNPFPGLRPFEPHESSLYFGRDDYVDELLAHLEKTRFLAVVGTSGGGKSSLIRAGLLPALNRGYLVGAGSHWRVALLRPGDDPIGELAKALGQPCETLDRSSMGLVEAAQAMRLEKRQNLLVIVDQFEELFRFHTLALEWGGGGEANAFVKLLLRATEQNDLPIYVVITMRSDYLGDCAQFSGLPEALNHGQYLIPRMTRDQLSEAIEGPVAVGRAEIAPRLVQRLLNDAGDAPDQLPILQHALMRTWEHWRLSCCHDVPIDLEHYRAVGDMAEALNRHADEVLNHLTEAQQEIAEAMFRCLTESDRIKRDTRRPTKLQVIADVVGAPWENVAAVADEFRHSGRNFITPPPGKPLEADSVLDIGHESLIRQWSKLSHWVEKEAQSAVEYQRLKLTACRWKKGEAQLWYGKDLVAIMTWKAQQQPTAAWACRYGTLEEFTAAEEFLRASEAEQQAKRKYEERQRAERLNSPAKREFDIPRPVEQLKTKDFIALDLSQAETLKTDPQPKELDPELREERCHYAETVESQLPQSDAPTFQLLEEKMAMAVIPCSDPMTPMYMLDRNFRIIDWNSAFSLCFDRTMEGRRGMSVLEWTYFLDNYEEVLDHGIVAFSDPQKLPRIDVEEVRFSSRYYGQIYATKRAYQVPDDDGSYLGWLITLDPKFKDENITQKFHQDLFFSLRQALMWSDYALSYDNVLNNTRLYPELLDILRGECVPGPTPIPANTRILDLGAGTGNMTRLLAEPAAQRFIVAIDNNIIMLNALRRKCEAYLRQDGNGPGVVTIKQDISSLYGLNNDFFDYVILNNVLYCLEDAAVTTCLREVNRVLKPGGEVRISGPQKRTQLKKVLDRIKHDLVENNAFDKFKHDYEKVKQINEHALASMLFHWSQEDMESLLLEVGFSAISYSTDKVYAEQSMLVCAKK